MRALGLNGKIAVQRFESQDFNRDGVLNLDGFKAAMLVPEMKMTPDDATEVYSII